MVRSGTLRRKSDAQDQWPEDADRRPEARAVPGATLTSHNSADEIARVQLTPMPQGTVRLGRDQSGAVDATVDAFGLTPGSSHAVELVNRDGRVVASLGTLT